MGILTDQIQFTGTPANDDVIHMVDVSDPTDNPAGTSFKVDLGTLYDYFYFTGNTSGGCISDLYVSNIHSCSPLRINPLDEGNIYFGASSGLTVGLLYTGGTRVGINKTNPNYDLHVEGDVYTSSHMGINESPRVGAVAGNTRLTITQSDSDGNSSVGLRVDHSYVTTTGNHSALMLRSTQTKTGSNSTLYGVNAVLGGTVAQPASANTGTHTFIAGRFKANFVDGTGTALNYALQLEDGNEGAGKFLKCIDSTGKAQWADITVTGSSGTAYWTSGSSGNYSVKVINDSSVDATADYALAEGYNTTASGTYSHAEGTSNLASGSASHAEGGDTGEGFQGTSATTSSAHAEGFGTLANGSAAHAEGQNTTASGGGAHSEGVNSIASGSAAHAEGINTTASGPYSHAEGFQSSATGNTSHAEGRNTLAGGDYSHAEGWGNIASGQASHAEGGGDGEGPAPNIASGISSHAEGADNIASGNWSHVEGFSTTASDDYSHAEGRSTTASGFISHAEGRGTEASGAYSHAEGRNTVSSGAYSHAEGWSNIASGQASHTEGYNNLASGELSHAEGGGFDAGGEIGVVYSSTTASNVGAHAEGAGTLASGTASHAEGYLNTASGSASHAGGYNSVASGEWSFIHSNNSLVSGARSVVLGGDGLTGATDDTVYVPKFNINDAVSSLQSDEFLGIRTNGDVINTPYISTKAGLFIQPTGSTNYTSFYYNLSDSSSWSGYTPEVLLYRKSDTITDAPTLGFFKQPDTGLAGPSGYRVLTSGTVIGSIDWYGANGAVQDPKLVSKIDTVITNANQYADLRFYTRNASGLDERMLIDEDGKVGIGTSTPTDTLHVSGATASAQFRLEQSFTPSSSGDTAGNVGSFAWDDTYMYIKTNTGWGRIQLDYGF